MEIDLPPHMEAAIHERVAAGEYASVREMVAQAVNLLLLQSIEEGWTVEELRAEIDEGLEAAARGEVTIISSPEEAREFFEGIKREGRLRLARPVEQSA